MAFNDRLKEARISKNLTQEELANKIGVAKSTMNGYEKGVSEPSINTISKIIDILEIDANFLYQDEINNNVEAIITIPEKKLLNNYRLLDSYGKKAVDSIINIEIGRINHQSLLIDNSYISKPYYANGASAGSGNYLSDDLDCSTITIPETSLSKKADFVLSVNGNSMLPTFENGDKVLVKKQESINLGEIGIFIINNESYIKELGKGKLISHNKEYEDIELNEFDYVTCIGKVIGKL